MTVGRPRKPRTRSFKSLGHIFAHVAESLRPPERLTVAEAAAKYRYLNNPGSYVGPWLNSTVPEMVEPMNELASRTKTALIFVGPAQASKTDSLLLNWATYSIKCDPMDMIFYMPTNSAARDFSIRRIDRLHRHSKEVGAEVLRHRDADNKFDKHYTSGMMLTLSWPSVTELAGKPVGRIALTDYDRMPDDIDGDGSPFDLASKRTTTFRSFAMTLAESSPSRPITNPQWIAATPHEAPPCDGILALYNRGDRRRLYWPCPHCGRYFEGEFHMLEWDEHENVAEAAETVRMICPHCAERIYFDDRYEMRQWSIWLKDGQGIDEHGRVFGEEPRNEIASFWLKGVAAAFVTWSKLVQTFLDASREFERTGSEEALKKFYNNDLGEPYRPKANELDRLPEVLKARAEPLPEREVPEGVRFLVACIDVQKNMFVVQVFGILPGEPYDTVVVDRFNIQKSERFDHDGDRLWVKPSTYQEDWDLITKEVILKQYPLADGSGRKMQIKLTCCDSGGKEGVTGKAYDYWRKLRKEGLSGRFILVKGDPKAGIPRTRITYPDSNRRDKLSIARGDVPVLMLNSNVLKDSLNGRLDCNVPGKGMYRMPDWLPDWFYQELCSEKRTEKGWENPPHSRNEAWDLSYYCLGLCASQLLQVEHITWGSPPGWCAEWDKNSLVTAPDGAARFLPQTPDIDFAKLAQELA
jgi:phage terminase large subunit GpA-like protein